MAPEAILGSIRTLQEAHDLAGLAERAAAGLLRLTAASATSAYVESDDREVAFAAAGDASTIDTEKRARSLAALAAGAPSAADAFRHEPGMHAVPFASPSARGALLVEYPNALLSEAETRVVAEFAYFVGIVAGGVVRGDRSRLPGSLEKAIADCVSEGVLAIRGGNIVALNSSGARMLGVMTADVIGRPLRELWPNLAQAVDRAQPFVRQRMRVDDVALLVSLRLVPEDRWRC